MRIENAGERSFYEIECAQQQWSVRQLSRQVGSSLYERLALSTKPAAKTRANRLLKDHLIEKIGEVKVSGTHMSIFRKTGVAML